MKNNSLIESCSVPTRFNFHWFSVVCLLTMHLLYFYLIVRVTNVSESDNFETVVFAMHVAYRACLALKLKTHFSL